MVRILDNSGEIIIENSRGFLERDFVLSEIEIGFAYIPFEFYHTYNVCILSGFFKLFLTAIAERHKSAGAVMRSAAFAFLGFVEFHIYLARFDMFELRFSEQNNKDRD